MLPSSPITTALADIIFTIFWMGRYDYEYIYFYQGRQCFRLLTAFYLIPKMFLEDAICASTSEVKDSPHPELRNVSINIRFLKLVPFQ